MEDLCTIFESENQREKSIDENWTLFKKTLLKSMEKNIPTNKITSRWNLPWITPDIRRLCQQKKRAWDSGKQPCMEKISCSQQEGKRCHSRGPSKIL